MRALAGRLGVRPTKQLGQNFVHDAGTVRRIAAKAGVQPGDVVLEVGPGLGSLTLALLAAGARVVVVEIDDRLAAELPATIAARRPDLAADPDGGLAAHLQVVRADALDVTELPALAGEAVGPAGAPTKLVANLPYNVAVPVILTLLARFPQLQQVLVMVQTEVAERLAAAPGSKAYGVPSVKAAWYAEATMAGGVGRQVFWPVPNVDSALVRLVRRDPPSTSASREEVFAVVDAAFGQRRKTLRAALAGWAGSPATAEELCRVAGIDPTLRGERLDVSAFARLAEARRVAADGPAGP
ncbi:dimethyladenosine transferase [Quadrisphaera granulorum]|uniref:Ribosomal RNA small subunit methyltransferase A n=1 Tax=Quadrisphaera granulorum TaxID=317664 RepID=A0A316AFN9_9ACTN|nr:dimethyladenosine transferase [Quadrisphaera granulorum]SZE98349.1 dimethyladenosine transferase [Quadrisphaera granulorum]